ncbi:helix-turn-helix domain-containing protein [Phormidium sp. CLA17]|uniref:helix-turn-helix domain-containing protein n=1 Tax=Leptolyngbya sp. Cla-17 TaxID=2803751 RepID=UPI0014917046|nr:helix-turn-helix domain-containing protein [Leptolyngbya sp. Cla-17]MBM0741645.1 helix-turn-helix domain-containing protein [Leptolyngbya sp. Cla-17]
MAGVSAIVIKESLEELGTRLRTVEQPIVKERLQVLYWLKRAQAPSISQIAVAIGRHRGTVQKWLALYRAQGLEALLVVKPTPGGDNRMIPMWAEVALAKRLQEPDNGFDSYGEVQHALYNVANTSLKFLISISREKLRPDYGDGFQGAPLHFI